MREPQAKSWPPDHVWGSRSALAGLNRVRGCSRHLHYHPEREWLDRSPGRAEEEWEWGGGVCILLSSALAPSHALPSVSALCSLTRSGSWQHSTGLELQPSLGPLGLPGMCTQSSHEWSWHSLALNDNSKPLVYIYFFLILTLTTPCCWYCSI